MDLHGRVAVITGAASGIGLALAERCLAEGMSVVMADIESDTLAAQSQRLAVDGAPVLAVDTDVSDPTQIEALRDAAIERFGAVHLLVNNAGVATGRTNLRTTAAQWQWVVGVNLLGVAYGCSTFAPLMVEQGEGHIVNTASEAGLTATPMLGSYHATKYGVVGLSESLAMELENTPVGVSCLCPELVDTRIFESTRNAPAEIGLRVPDNMAISMIEEFLGSKAMDPADIAGQVLYAVRRDQFWIISHPITSVRVADRNRDLETRRNPRFQPF
jgi:NAD(P)-dependent dehydrogenase (short-subunit alcohol dehydrogenase family)